MRISKVKSPTVLYFCCMNICCPSALPVKMSIQMSKEDSTIKFRFLRRSFSGLDSPVLDLEVTGSLNLPGKVELHDSGGIRRSLGVEAFDIIIMKVSRNRAAGQDFFDETPRASILPGCTTSKTGWPSWPWSQNRSRWASLSVPLFVRRFWWTERVPGRLSSRLKNVFLISEWSDRAIVSAAGRKFRQRGSCRTGTSRMRRAGQRLKSPGPGDGEHHCFRRRLPQWVGRRLAMPDKHGSTTGSVLSMKAFMAAFVV